MRTSQVKKSEISDRLRKFRDRTGLSQKELGKQLGVSGNYIYLIESGQKSPGESLQKLFETFELSPLYHSESVKEGREGRRFSGTPGATGFDGFGTETLKQMISDYAGHLPGADTIKTSTVLENIREMMAVLTSRLRGGSEASSKQPSEAQSAAKRASASAKTDPEE